jgi:hypothetical protein
VGKREVGDGRELEGFGEIKTRDFRIPEQKPEFGDRSKKKSRTDWGNGETKLKIDARKKPNG